MERLFNFGPNGVPTVVPTVDELAGAIVSDSTLKVPFADYMYLESRNNPNRRTVNCVKDDFRFKITERSPRVIVNALAKYDEIDQGATNPRCSWLETRIFRSKRNPEAFKVAVRYPGLGVAQGEWLSAKHFDSPEEVADLMKDDFGLRGVLQTLLGQVAQRVAPAAPFCDA